jgi:hypothetical protein
MATQNGRTPSGDGTQRRGGRGGGGGSEFVEEAVDFDGESGLDYTRVERGVSRAVERERKGDRGKKRGDDDTWWPLCWGGEVKGKDSGARINARPSGGEEMGDPVQRSAGRQRPENSGRGRVVASAHHTGACPQIGEAARWGPDTVPGAWFKRV